MSTSIWSFKFNLFNCNVRFVSNIFELDNSSKALNKLPDINLSELYDITDLGVAELHEESRIRYFKLNYFLNEIRKNNLEVGNLIGLLEKNKAKTDFSLANEIFVEVTSITNKAPELGTLGTSCLQRGNHAQTIPYGSADFGFEPSDWEIIRQNVEKARASIESFNKKFADAAGNKNTTPLIVAEEHAKADALYWKNLGLLGQIHYCRLDRLDVKVRTLIADLLVGNTKIKGFERALNKATVNEVKKMLIKKYYELTPTARVDMTFEKLVLLTTDINGNLRNIMEPLVTRIVTRLTSK